MSKIWVKLIELDDKKYCYDVGTNHLMDITDSMYDALSIYNYDNKEEVLDRLAAKYGVEEISDTIGRIIKFNKEEGGFILERRIRLKFPFDKEEYKFVLDNFLSHLVLNITEDCNLRCRYCSFGGHYKYRRTHKKVSMSWEMMQKAIDFFIPRSTLRPQVTDKPLLVGFYGGETLLEYKKMFKAVEYIKETYPDVFPDIRFSITNNATLLNREIIEKLILYDFNLPISLDGPREVHDRNRVFKNGSGTYDTIMKNLELIKSIDFEYYKKNVIFCSVISPPYELKKVIDYFREEAKDLDASCSFNMVEPVYTTYFDQFDMKKENKAFLEQSLELTYEFIEKTIRGENDPTLSDFLKEKYNDLHHRKVFKLPESTYPNGICLPAIKKLFVDTDGRFHLCERSTLKFPYGNLDDGFDVDRIFQYIGQYIESTDHCNKCWAIRLCSSCFLSAVKDDRFSKERKHKDCQQFRGTSYSRLQTYITILERNPDSFKKQFGRGEDMVEELVKYMIKRKSKLKEKVT